MNKHVEPAQLALPPAVETKLCRECEKPFTPRSGSGGKPQVYCSDECKKLYDKRRGTYNPNAAQRGEASVGVVAAQALGVAPEPVKPASEQKDEELVWEIPRQDEITFRKDGDSVLIEQTDGVGDSYSIRISLPNAVGFARRVLWAAGFDYVMLSAGDNGMTWIDLDDGAEAKKT